MTIVFFIVNLLLFVIYGSILFIVNRTKRQRASLYVFLISVIHILIIQFFLDYEKLLDSFAYIYAFQDAKYSSFSEIIKGAFENEWGVGFMLYNKVASYITNDSHMYYMMSYIIIDIPLLWYFYKVSHNYTFSLLLYLCHPMLFWDSNYILRQHMAISLSAIALYYSDKRKVSIPMSFVAASMHTPALIIIPYLIWKEFKLSKASGFKIVSLVMISLLVMSVLLYLIVAQSARYSRYLSAENSSNIMPFLVLAPLVVILFTKRRFLYKNAQESNLFEFLLLGLVVVLFTMNSPFGRITTYFLTFVPAAVPMIFKYSNKKSVVSLSYVCLLLLIEFYMLNVNCTGLYKGNLIQ